jgi:ketosteroid isomerase-like protein
MREAYNFSMLRATAIHLSLPLLLGFATPMLAQNLPSIPATQAHLTPLPTPTLTPGQLELIKLEAAFSDAVQKGGGQAFAGFFADDGVTLNNGKPAVLGRTAIAANARWDPKTYHLSWYPEGAQMGPSGDTGFTWGHYDASTTDTKGEATSLSGRYITVWKKVGSAWKVALDASADEPPPAH